MVRAALPLNTPENVVEPLLPPTVRPLAPMATVEPATPDREPRVRLEGVIPLKLKLGVVPVRLKARAESTDPDPVSVSEPELTVVAPVNVLAAVRVSEPPSTVRPVFLVPDPMTS